MKGPKNLLPIKELQLNELKEENPGENIPGVTQVEAHERWGLELVGFKLVNKVHKIYLKCHEDFQLTSKEVTLRRYNGRPWFKIQFNLPGIGKSMTWAVYMDGAFS